MCVCVCACDCVELYECDCVGVCVHDYMYVGVCGWDCVG